MPKSWRFSGVHFFHGDAIFHRADQRAEVATDAIFLDDSRDVNSETSGIFLRGFLVRLDALMRAVFAGDVTELAADA